MKLTSKSVKPLYKETVVQKHIEPDFESVIPYGKWKDAVLGDVQRADPNYYKWLVNEGMISKWFLYKDAQQKIKPIDNTGNLRVGNRTYIGLRVIEEHYKPSEWL